MSRRHVRNRPALTASLASMVLVAGVGASPALAASPPAVAAALVPVEPGPAILYSSPPRAPQLENVDIWNADPILISGASAYRGGEFLYQDFLYDDLGANSGYRYPTAPTYAGNAADLVEVRLKLLAMTTAIRLTYNTMVDPEIAATTVALGDAAVSLPLPHGANASAPAKVFITVHGTVVEVVNAATGLRVAGHGSTATVDLERRQVDVRIPFSTFDPRDQPTLRIAAAAGLWDTTRGSYRIPQHAADATNAGGGIGPRATAIFNAAFRYDEPLVGGTAAMREGQQSSALLAGDLSPFFAMVDVAKLTAGASDEMHDQRGGVPTRGYLNRIYASHFETAQGRGDAVSLRPSDCHTPCVPHLAGQLQGYSLYVPLVPAPVDGFALTLQLHGSGATANSFQGSPGVEVFAGRGDGGLVLTPEARGPSYWYEGQAGADVFEAWADVRRHYPLDATETVITGSSMGGYGAYRLAALHPDLFAAVLPVVPCPTAGTLYVPGLEPPGGAASALINLTASLRHVPAMSLQSANDQACTFAGDYGAQAIYTSLDTMGYPYEARTFYGAEHALVGSLLLNVPEPLVEFAAGRRVVTDPAHITYVVNDALVQPDFGLTADHAYWVSGIRVRDTGQPLPIGTVDVRTFGLGRKDAPVAPIEYNQGLHPGSVYPFTGQYRRTGAEIADTSVLDRVDLLVRNVASITIDPDRAGLTCGAQVNVDSDGPVEVVLAGCPETQTPGNEPTVPTQLIAKVFTGGLGRLPTQAEYQEAVDAFEAAGCTADSIEDFGSGVLGSSEFASRGYDPVARVITLFRTVLNRDPDPSGFEHFHDALAAGVAWADVVAEAHDLEEFDRVVELACGPDPDYGFGWQQAIAVPTSGAGFVGGSSVELQALLDATPVGGTVWLAQKALVEVITPITVPAGVTLATSGTPARTSYAQQARFVRRAYFPAAMITLQPGATLRSVWVDGQRGTAPDQLSADLGLGQGGYTLTLRNTPGITASVNVSIVGGTLVDSMLTSTSGWATVVLGTQDGSMCEALVAGNLVTAYTSQHGGAFSDGISNYCDHAIIEYNEIVDTTDVGLISFPPSSLGPQHSQVRHNVVLSAGNNAYGALVTDGTLSNKTEPPNFTGSVFHDNLIWTSERTHFDIAISVGTRAWFGQNSATSFGAAFRDNTTGVLGARVAIGIAVSGMLDATVQGNTLTTSFAPEAAPCPRVEIGVSETAGYGSGDIQGPYDDVLIEQCIQTGA